MDIQDRVQKLYPGKIVELFILDLSAIGGTILRFHSSTSQGNASIFFGGDEYVAYPIDSDSWEVSGNSQLPRPKMRVSNIPAPQAAGSTLVNSPITALMNNYNGLRKAEITRIRTFWEYTDGQPEADPTQTFPLDVYYIARKTSEDETQVEFELRAACDVSGIQLPRGQVLAHACQWLYRGPECAYTDERFFDLNENPLVATNSRGLWNTASVYAVADYVYVLVNGTRFYYVCAGPTVVGLQPALDVGWTADICGKKTSSCKCREGVSNSCTGGVMNTSAFVGTFLLLS